MKKTIISMAAAALCACVLSVQAYAEDVLTDKSIYLENREEMAQSVEGWVIDGKTIIPDVDTIMPVYNASIYDYAKTGNFKIEPDGQMYFSNALDKDGNYAGSLQLAFENGTFRYSTFGSSNDRSNSIAFEANAKRVNALMKKRGLNTDCKEVKLVLIEGVGSAYYIDNGTEKMLVAANISDVNERIFNAENGGIVVIGDELKAAADVEFAKHNKYLEERRKLIESLDLGPDDPLPIVGGGYDMPTFKVDNTPYLDNADDPAAPDSGSSEGSKNDNPNTGADESAQTAKRMAVLTVELSALAAAGIGITVINKKRKNKN